METYRKPDQYYIDEYDRSTIKTLKTLEKELKKAKKSISEQFIARVRYQDSAILASRNRDITIQSWILEDEKKDRLVQQTLPPGNIKCNKCGGYMNLIEHCFFGMESLIMFAYDCPNGHTPRKIVYPDGKEYFFPEIHCNDCGSTEKKSKSIKTKKYLIWKVECAGCGKVTTDKIDRYARKETISNADREKYCINLKGRKTMNESLEEIGILYERFIKPAEERKKHDTDKIEKLTIPQLETRLTKLSKKMGFIKFRFHEPEFKGRASVTLSLQDPSTRNGNESITLLTKALKKELFYTNWRIDSITKVMYRLGILTGKLKAYETDEDLIKIAKEIAKRKKPIL